MSDIDPENSGIDPEHQARVQAYERKRDTRMGIGGGAGGMGGAILFGLMFGPLGFIGGLLGGAATGAGAGLLTSGTHPSYHGD